MLSTEAHTKPVLGRYWAPLPQEPDFLQHRLCPVNTLPANQMEAGGSRNAFQKETSPTCSPQNSHQETKEPSTRTNSREERRQVQKPRPRLR